MVNDNRLNEIGWVHETFFSWGRKGRREGCIKCKIVRHSLDLFRAMTLNAIECLWMPQSRVPDKTWLLDLGLLSPSSLFLSLSMFLSFGLSVCLSFFLSLFFHLSIHFAFIFILLSQKGSQYKSCTDPDWYVACQQNPIAIPINDNIDNNDSNSGSFKCFWLPSPSSRL